VAVGSFDFLIDIAEKKTGMTCFRSENCFKFNMDCEELVSRVRWAFNGVMNAFYAWD
jgi:hypothetical protein